MKAIATKYRIGADRLVTRAADDILRFVGDGKAVLEFGAGPAALGARLVERNHARLTVVAADARSAEPIGSICERVIEHDLDDPEWARAVADTRFDAVVMSGVLEHVLDPWTLLRQAASVLAEDGVIVASIPHAGHAAMLGCLLAGNIEYCDGGRLDRTPIRLFGIRNIQALFDDAGLEITDFAYVQQAPGKTEYAAQWRELPSRTRAVLEEGAFARVWQVVVQARAADPRAAAAGRRLPDEPPAAVNRLKLIAFYLPQFHPIPENDAWWGKGFTEWTNTSKAEPLFPGHYQPHQPGELGYYDLRLRETQREQIALATRFGIDAFCFHYYWFDGRRLLEKPLDDFLADADARIEFCISWANENWTRTWDASEHEVLMEQVYSPEGDVAFIESLLPFFADPRYLRVDGKPVLLVYRPQHIPDPVATAERWRIFCRANGVGEIHLVAALTHNNWNYERFGFDAGVEFPPHNLDVPNLNVRWPFDAITGLVTGYRDVARQYLEQDYSTRRVYRTVVPSWDNTARVRTRAVILLDGDPQNYERWLDAAAVRTITERAPTDRLLFINAWNEWAEGCHLEPDRRYGSAFLEATRRVKDGRSMIDPVFPEPALPPPHPVLPSQWLRAFTGGSMRAGQGGSGDQKRPPSLGIPLLAIGRTTETVPHDIEIVHLITPSYRGANDRRRLGALVTGITIDGIPLPLDSASLAEGFHAIELHGENAVRWTDGVGSIAIGTGATDRFIEIDVARVMEPPAGRQVA